MHLLCHVIGSSECVRTNVVRARPKTENNIGLNGYHGIELEKEDRHKTTFAREWGLFRYRKPHKDTCDMYGKHTDAILEDRPSTTEIRDWEKIVDDIITW